MANFMRGFSQGITDGAKLGEMYRNAMMQKELKDANKTDQQQTTEYTPDQIRQLQGDTQEQDGETWNQEQGGFVNQDGGLRVPSNVPTIKDGQYQSNGATVAPATHYRLGIQDQDKAFSAEDIAQAKLNAKADIYSNYGKEDMAETMRGNALTRGLQSRQLAELDKKKSDDATLAGYIKQADQFNTDFTAHAQPIIDQIKNGEVPMQVGIPKVLDYYNQQLPNGEHIAYDQNKGHLYKTNGGKVEQIKGPDGKPLVLDSQHLDSIVSAAGDRTSAWLRQKQLELNPNLLSDHLKSIQDQGNKDREYSAGREDAASNVQFHNDTLGENKRQFGLSNDLAIKKYESDDANKKSELGIQRSEASARAGYYKGIVGAKEDTKLTAQEQSDLSALSDAYDNATTPKEQAAAAKKLEVFQHKVAISRGKYPSFGGLSKDPKDDKIVVSPDGSFRTNQTTGNVDDWQAPVVKNGKTVQAGKWVPRGDDALTKLMSGGVGGITDDAAPAKPKAGLKVPQKVAPVSSNNDFETMLSDARRGGTVGLNYIHNLQNSGEPTTPLQRQLINEALNGR
jgi:hypothetical protein